MNDFIILSIAFGDPRYKQQLLNLKQSIANFHPTIPFHYWIDGEMPPGSKSFSDSMYGFKVWAVNYAKEHEFKKVLWFDPAIIVVNTLEPYFKLVEKYGAVAAEDDNLLANYCGDKAFTYFGKAREDSRLMKEHLCGGSVYAFNFDIELSCKIFERWKQAEVDGMFGSQAEAAAEQNNMHRNDESIMSLALYEAGSSPTPYDICRYNNVPNPLVVKKHFK